MTQPVVTSGWFGDEPTVSLRHGTSLLVVALRGATILRWVLDLGDGPVDLLDGYRDADELRSQDGIRNGIMAPFCDRVAGAAYVFDGQDHDLLPGSTSRLVYHGLVRSMPFTLDLVDADDDGLAATFRCHGLTEAPQPGYPFPVDVDVTYRLGPASLGVQIDGHNTGTVPAPFASGWHPYFRLPGAATVDELELRVAATTRVETDADLIPLPGPDAYAAVAPDEARWRPVGDAVLDVGYLAGGPAVVRSPSSGVELTLTQSAGLVHVFTGDTISRDRRRAIAVEPVETLTDAFNRPDCSAAVRLGPGARRTFGATVTVTRAAPAVAG
ncbi:MAG TPA: aldose 1-epimerase [Cellulomonas sp.]|uniref:aldose 1-epimerase n=1 Tax=Cellulomonas sp. TaxID=40001 RepID=UPI002E32E888|nr:aldose 1-epimerase [Cellulomonas sp.]HEX5331840.1 aldose 1-epimerase [Cellulomonas sp.]